VSKQAAADVVVPRASLAHPDDRRGIRIVLFQALSQLGYVEKVERYVQDPPDGPYGDSFYDDLDRDRFAVIRIIGRVIPRS
jgi:hypothetical protein